MKTVRLSQTLKHDILQTAEEKFRNVNPGKSYPEKGLDVLESHGVTQKIEKTRAQFKEIWDMDMPLKTIDKVKIKAEGIETIGDEGHPSEPESRAYTLSIPEMEVPSFICSDSYYDTALKVKVEPDDPVFSECYQIEVYNENLEKQMRKQRMELDITLDKFPTLNQLLKAAPWISKLVPPERIQKMHEKDDRKRKQQEQQEIAETELSNLKNTVLSDSLLGGTSNE